MQVLQLYVAGPAGFRGGFVKKLLVLANEFPYGTWEPYMETEEQYYSRFDKVWIASLQLRKDHAETKRELKCGANIIPVFYKSRLFYLLNSITVLADGQLYKEISKLRREGRFSPSRLVDLFVFLSRAHHEARVIDKALKNEDKKDILLYSYRFEYQPYIAVLLKEKWGITQYIVSRAHGYDIYEEQHSNNYIPLRTYILNKIDYLFPCSRHGIEYVNDRYKDIRAKVECRYLGTVDHGKRVVKKDSAKIRLVSCSNVVKVKRLEKIVNALSLIKDIDIEWTHYGDGPLMDDIKHLAEQKFGNNITCFFPGNVANQQLLVEYASKDFDFFVNVSSSEGLPVSIMEAMSFGIPCIVTDVGGTKEIVNDKNGFLLNADVSDDAIAQVISECSYIDEDRYRQLRDNARSFWNDKFNSDHNYTAYVDELIKL